MRVAKAYDDEVLYKRVQERLVTHDALAKSYNKLKDDLNRKHEDFYGIAQELGVADAVNRDAETDLLLREITDLQKMKADLERQLIQQHTDYLVMKQRLEGPLMVEPEVSEKLNQDPQMLMMQQQMFELHMRSRKPGRPSKVAAPKWQAGWSDRWPRSIRT